MLRAGNCFLPSILQFSVSLPTRLSLIDIPTVCATSAPIVGCLSNKATTICGHSVWSLRQVPVQHNRRGKLAEIKVRFAPPTMCRLTIKLDILIFGGIATLRCT